MLATVRRGQRVRTVCVILPFEELDRGICCAFQPMVLVPGVVARRD